MSAIEVKPEKDYVYVGHIRMKRDYPLEASTSAYIVCRDAEGENPLMLEARGDMKRYVNDLMNHPFREASMPKRFHYDSWCVLHGVDVLDDAGKVVKIVCEGGEWRPFIGEIKEREAEDDA